MRRNTGARFIAALICCGSVHASAMSLRVAPNWGAVEPVAAPIVSIQVCVEPPMRRGSPIHDQIFKALRDLKANYARFQPWRPYPRLAVAELFAPHDGQTSWDFSLIDPLVEDFMAASEDRPVIFTFGTIPSWMFRTRTPDVIPDDPNEISWTYGMSSEFSNFDSTVKLFARYQARLAEWYLAGGFSDEYGRWHASGHRYRNIAYWGVLNEPGAEHKLTPEQYTRVYDAVVSAVRRVAPRMKFVGLADDSVWTKRALPENFTYFLQERNHSRGIPVDAFSYHYYVFPDADETEHDLEHTSFKDVDRLLTAASFIEALRQSFAPHAEAIIEELGGPMLPWADSAKQLSQHAIANSHWRLSAATWAHAYGQLAGIGLKMVLGAELIDYPDQAPTLSLVDWNTGIPHDTYWVLKLLNDHFKAGTKVVARSTPDFVDASQPENDAAPSLAKLSFRAFVAPNGKRMVLLVNKRSEPITVSVAGAAGGHLEMVDHLTSQGLVAVEHLPSESIGLPDFGVAIVTLPASTAGQK